MVVDASASARGAARWGQHTDQKPDDPESNGHRWCPFGGPNRNCGHQNDEGRHHDAVVKDVGDGEVQSVPVLHFYG